MFKKILITKDGKKLWVKELTKDFHTQYGFIKQKDLEKNNVVVKTNTGKELTIFSPYFIDIYEKIKRVPQIITLKDIGLIITETGINKNSIVVDAGAGSGALACFLAHIVKKVYTYEIREDFTKVVKENIKLLKLKNIIVKNKDIYNGIDEKQVDLITLDLPNPEKVLKHAENTLKVGGFLVSYSPSITQTMKFVNKLKNYNFVHLKSLELILREWEINGNKVRPKTKGIGHTGFLSFARRIIKT